MPMHGNTRYVKLAWIWLTAALAAFLPSAVAAEMVAPTEAQGALAVARDGSARVAYVSGRDVVVARRQARDRWSFTGLRTLPAGRAHIAGLVIDARGRPSVLAAADNGSWLALAPSGRKLRVVARARQGASLGSAGLTLDRAGRPAVAYAERLSTSKTYLRLVRTDTRGRLRTTPITKGGFPSSGRAPSAMPVLVQGTVHVVETYGSSAIDWRPQPKGGWSGQFLYSSRTGLLTGRIGAVAAGSTLWASWTQADEDTVRVLLAQSSTTQRTSVVLEHGFFVSLLLESGRPELGAYDWVGLNEWFGYASVIADETGPVAELDGRLNGYARTPRGGRQILLSTPSGLEWFETPARPAVKVALNADASGRLTGRVEGVAAGVVELYRDGPNGRTPVGVAELGADGSFAAQDPAPITSPTFYRAVYVDPATTVPYASLLRTPLSPG
jgi:hypothetical protein